MKVFLAIILLASTAHADPVKIQTHYISPGTAYTIPDVGHVRYYLFQEYKILLKVDHDLFLANDRIGNLQRIVEDQTRVVQLQLSFTKSVERERDIYKDRSLRLHNTWYKCEEKLIKESGFDLKSFLIGLAVGSAAVAVTGTILIIKLN